MHISQWLRTRRVGINHLPHGVTPLLTSASPKTTASETIPSTTQTYSNHKYHQLTPTRAAPLAKERVGPSPMSSSETQRKNQHQIDTISLELMSIQGTGPKARHSVSAGEPMRKTTSNTDPMPMQSFTPKKTHQLNMKVFVSLLSKVNSRRQQAQVQCLRKTEDVFREDGWGKELGAWSTSSGQRSPSLWHDWPQLTKLRLWGAYWPVQTCKWQPWSHLFDPWVLRPLYPFKT